MVSRRTRVVSWIFRRDHPSRPKATICCFFSSFKTFAMSREATDPPAAVNVLDVSSESMAAFGCSLRLHQLCDAVELLSADIRTIEYEDRHRNNRTSGRTK